MRDMMQAALPLLRTLEGTFANSVRYRRLVRDWGYNLMAKAEDYRRFASECLKLGQTAADETTRSLFLQMARAWLALAQKDETEGHNGDPEKT